MRASNVLPSIGVQPPAVAPVPSAVPHPSSDPFAKVRGLGGALVVMLGLRASMRVVTYIVHRVTYPPPGQVTMEQLDAMRMVDLVLLGLENLVTLVAMITFLVWIHRVFVSIRASGRTTSYSPGMAVGGWFIPLANAVLPWLTVRDALKSLGKPTALAGAWWLAWLIVIPFAMFQNLGRQMTIVPQLVGNLRDVPGPLGKLLDQPEKLFDLVQSSFWPHFILDTLAWGLLLVIVAMVSKAGAEQR